MLFFFRKICSNVVRLTLVPTDICIWGCTRIYNEAWKNYLGCAWKLYWAYLRLENEKHENFKAHEEFQITQPVTYIIDGSCAAFLYGFHAGQVACLVSGTAYIGFHLALVDFFCKPSKQKVLTGKTKTLNWNQSLLKALTDRLCRVYRYSVEIFTEFQDSLINLPYSVASLKGCIHYGTSRTRSGFSRSATSKP